jgi:hypothetical protein
MQNPLFAAGGPSDFIFFTPRGPFPIYLCTVRVLVLFRLLLGGKPI